jgi:hypothetical protein
MENRPLGQIPTGPKPGVQDVNQKSSFLGSDRFSSSDLVDILIAMSQGAYDLNWKDVKGKSGLILYDRSLITPERGRSQTGGLALHGVCFEETEKQAGGQPHPSWSSCRDHKDCFPKAIRKAIVLHVSERFRFSISKPFG